MAAQQNSNNEESAMEINISVLKDHVDAIGSAGDAVAKIADGIRHVVTTGVEGYDAVKVRRTLARLTEVSSRCVTQTHSNVAVISAIERHTERQPLVSDDERHNNWAKVLESVETALSRASTLSEGLSYERSDFVLEPAYAQLQDSLAARKHLLAELRCMTPPASFEELQLVRKVADRHHVLIRELRRARVGLNAYLKSLNAPKE